MANIQLQAYGDERDAYSAIVPETEDDTLDKTVMVLYDEDTDPRDVAKGLDRIILKLEKGPLSGV